ncbi:hypothetical protein TNCV_237941 [Trichonephila clavipes]|nr:hypothetical protein TNCV_237941 [Trichonephila clavipes]
MRTTSEWHSLLKIPHHANGRTLIPNIFNLHQPFFIEDLQLHQDLNPQFDNAGREYMIITTELPWPPSTTEAAWFLENGTHEMPEKRLGSLPSEIQHDQFPFVMSRK